MIRDILKRNDSNNTLNVNRHSDEIRDIVTTMPSLLIRKGMILFLCIFIMIIGIAGLVRFPDVLNASLLVTGSSVGEMTFPQSELQKLHIGQRVSLNAHNFAFKNSKSVEGEIVSIIVEPDKGDSVIKVIAKIRQPATGINLTKGMLADAQILTSDISVLKRISVSILHPQSN